MKIDELIDLFNRVYDFSFNITASGGLVYTVKYSEEESVFEINPEDVGVLLKYEDNLEVVPVRITKTDYNEFLLYDNSGIPFLNRTTKLFEDKENHLTYELSSPSPRMIVAILKYAITKNNDIINEIRSRTRRSYWLRERSMKDNSLWFLYESIIPRYISLKMIPESGYSLDRIDGITMCTSFSFNYAYNLGRVIYQTDNVEDIYNLYSSGRVRRGKSEEMEPPKKKFIPELVSFYLRATSGDSRDYQFLSYYHILEFFFVKVFLDSVVAQIRGELTHPSFSYKRDKDIKGLYNKVKKVVRESSVQSGINESESLKLTLKKFVPDLLRVRDNLNGVSTTIVDFLKTETGPFSKNTINFDIPDLDLVYANIAGRIYSTRNAIAHSKETDTKEKFIPFKHDGELLNEVLLIRIVAEEVIINSSKDL